MLFWRRMPNERRYITSPRGIYVWQALSAEEVDRTAYLLMCAETRAAVLVDAPGAATTAERVARAATDLHAHVRMIVLTHGHPEQWGALGLLRDRLGAQVGIHLEDAAMLPLTPDFALADGQRIAFGAAVLRVLHTPGHTAGSVCLVGDGQLFTGETLLPGGPLDAANAGAPPPADPARLMRSLRESVFRMAPTTAVLPARGAASTLAAEVPRLGAWAAWAEAQG